MTSARDAATTVPSVSLLRRVAASFVTALAGAASVHLGSIVLFLIGSLGLNFTSTLGVSQQGILAAIHAQFIPSTLFLLVAFFVFGFIGVFRSWYFALAGGLVLGGAAVLGGTTVLASQQGTGISLPDLLATLVTFNFPFVAAAMVVAPLLGVPLFRRITRGRSAAGVFAGTTAGERRVALVRVPADNLAEGISSTGATVDVDLANEQWDAYVSALLDNGWSTIEVPAAPTLADSVFVEDAAVVFGGIAVIASPGAESRTPEIAGAEHSLRELGLRIERIQAPGTLDGGDVLKVGTTVYVGRSARTNAEGVRQLRAILAGTEFSVIAVPVEKTLHLKSAVTALPDGTVIGDASLIGDTSVFERFLAMPEPGAEVVVLGADTVLMAASAPRSQALVADLGYAVVSVDISEFEKLDGCVTCLSIRVR